jgi:hypothetical protein
MDPRKEKVWCKVWWAAINWSPDDDIELNVDLLGSELCVSRRIVGDCDEQQHDSTGGLLVKIITVFLQETQCSWKAMSPSLS